MGAPVNGVDPEDAPACKAGGKQKKGHLVDALKQCRASDVSKVAVQLRNEAEETMQKEVVDRVDKDEGVTILSILRLFEI